MALMCERFSSVFFVYFGLVAPADEIGDEAGAKKVKARERNSRAFGNGVEIASTTHVPQRP